MAEGKLPWFKFYPSNWRADPNLSLCSLAARGLWIEIITLMHESKNYGELLINGRTPNDEDLSKLIGVPIFQVQSAIDELETNGVFSRRRNGVIYSRRMERDEIKRSKNRDNGKLGGNPTLLKQRENNRSDNPMVNDGVNPYSKDREIEDREIETDTNSESNPSTLETDINKKEKNKKKKKINGAAQSEMDQFLDGIIDPEPENKKIVYSQEFENWWIYWPNKIAKIAVFKKFNLVIKKRQATYDELMVGVQNYIETPTAKKGYYTHPITWFNQGRWADEVRSVNDWKDGLDE